MNKEAVVENKVHKREDKLSFFGKNDLPFAIGCPALVWQVVFFYLPILFMVISSFFKVSPTGLIEGLTFANFQTALSKELIIKVFESLGLAFLNACSCFLLALPFAYFIAIKVKRYKTLCLIFLIIPFWTNFLLHVCAWFFVLEKHGFLNNFLIALRLIDEPIQFLNSFFSIMVMMVYHYLPFMVLPLYSALEKFDQNLLLASADLGASKTQTIKKVLIPILTPAIKLGFFLVYIPSFGEFVIPELMGGDKHYFVGNIVQQFMLGESTGSLGAAFTVVSAIGLIASILFVNKGINILTTKLKGGAL